MIVSGKGNVKGVRNKSMLKMENSHATIVAPCWLVLLRGYVIMKDLSCIVAMPLIIFPIIYGLFAIFAQGHLAY